MIADLSKDDSIWAKYRQLFKRNEIPAKTVLLSEGQISKKVFYIERGCLRICFYSQGKDITFQFFFEGEVVSSIESFTTNQASLFTIESIESSVIYSINKKDFEQVVNTSAEIRKEVENYTLERLILYQKLFLSRIRDKPETRYSELLKSNPKILQRVPQHYIASFLGITPVSLSRIRNRH